MFQNLLKPPVKTPPPKNMDVLYCMLSTWDSFCSNPTYTGEVLLFWFTCSQPEQQHINQRTLCLEWSAEKHTAFYRFGGHIKWPWFIKPYGVPYKHVFTGGIGVEFRKLFLAVVFPGSPDALGFPKEQVHAAVGGTSAGFLTHQKTTQFGI